LKLSNVRTERPAPSKTIAPERGNIPIKVPSMNDGIGTLAAARKKLVNAKGITTDIRINVMTEIVLRKPSFVNAR
jgi:hypothetical protein